MILKRYDLIGTEAVFISFVGVGGKIKVYIQCELCSWILGK